MKSEVAISTAFFTKEAVVAFLRNFGRTNTKDYEFAVALILHHFCEKQWKEQCWIGFQIRSDYLKSLPSFSLKKTIGLAEITELFKKGIDEDSPIDLVVAKETDKGKAQGMVFQVKRFGVGRIKKDTDELVKYLKDLFSRKYGRTGADLVISLDDGVKIEMEKLYAKVDMTNTPFNRVLFTWISDDKTVYLKDVYPRGNTEQCPIAKLY